MAGREFYRMAVAEVLDVLETGARGLTKDEVDRRLGEYGKNELTARLEVPRWLLFLSQFKDLLVIVLIVAAVISFVIGSFRDGTVMLVIVAINAVIGFVQEYKVSKILESLKNLIQSPAKVVRDGETKEISQDLLVPGDIVRLEAGDKIPADLRIVESFDLRMEEFSLTGESTPQGKGNQAIQASSVLADRENMAFMGTAVVSGSATGVVVGTGMKTEMGRIADMTQETDDPKSPLEKELGALAKWLTLAVVIISALLFAVALWQGFTLFTSMVYALGIAVALVPQALPAQVTVAMSTTSRRLAEMNAVVKSLPAVETLGSTSVICTDKTGTLTKNEMTVTSIWFNGTTYGMTGTGYEPEGEILDGEGASLSPEEIDEIEIMMDAATMASNAEIHEPDKTHEGWYPVGDPTEAALITMSTKLGTRSPIEDEENPELHEFPFDSDRKRMSSVRQFGDRTQLAMKGAPDSVLSVSRSIYRDQKAEPLTDVDREAIRSVTKEFSSRALRVLAVAYRPLESDGQDYRIEEAEKDVVFLGLVGMMDPPREGAREAIGSCHQARIKTFIITGDHALTAQAIGREIGLSETGDPSPAITGQELKERSDEGLADLMAGEQSMIFSRVDPEDKLRIVNILEEREEVVAMTGDGVNDAPALKRASIGVAMGRIGTDVAKEASELVLLDDSFPTLVDAIREGRTIYQNLKKTILASMTTNMAELVVVLLGLAAVSWKGWAIPILAIQILAIDLLAEILPLTFLTYDPPSKGIMTSPPRKTTEHIMNKLTATEVILLGTLIGALAFANYALFMLREGVWFTVDHASSLPYARATAITYLTIAYCQFVNVLSRRYEFTTLFNRNILTNRILLASILGSAGLMMVAVYAPYVKDFMRFEGPLPLDWVYILGAAGIYLAVFELLKLFRRKARGRGKDLEAHGA